MAHAGKARFGGLLHHTITQKKRMQEQPQRCGPMYPVNTLLFRGRKSAPILEILPVSCYSEENTGR